MEQMSRNSLISREFRAGTKDCDYFGIFVSLQDFSKCGRNLASMWISPNLLLQGQRETIFFTE